MKKYVLTLIDANIRQLHTSIGKSHEHLHNPAMAAHKVRWENHIKKLQFQVAKAERCREVFIKAFVN